MITALAVIFVFSLVVVVHELGHFLVCRLLGVRVETFAVGFGKELFGVNWAGTRWSFCILPLGGYVKPAGEDQEETTGAPDEYFGQTWYRRILIALAGPVMNYVLAVTCFFVLLFFWGQPTPSAEPVVGEVVAGYPAQAAGLSALDRIVSINGRAIASWEQAAQVIHAFPEKTIDIRYRRSTPDGAVEERSVAIVPKKDPQRGVGLIGISPQMEVVRHGFRDSWKLAAQQTWHWTRLTVVYLYNAVAQRQKPELAGPLGIVTIVAKVAQEGFQELVGLIALISLSLGLFNFFPIPLLDGGHVFLYLIEGILGHPLNKKAVRAAHIVGATFLILVFVFATSQDLSRLKDMLWR